MLTRRSWHPRLSPSEPPELSVKSPIETFTIRSEGAGSGATLVLEWEKTRVRIPVKPAS